MGHEVSMRHTGRLSLDGTIHRHDNSPYLYCICQAKERRVSEAHQGSRAALRPVPEMDLHVRFAAQEDLDRQRLGLRPDMHR